MWGRKSTCVQDPTRNINEVKKVRTEGRLPFSLRGDACDEIALETLRKRRDSLEPHLSRQGSMQHINPSIEEKSPDFHKKFSILSGQQRLWTMEFAAMEFEARDPRRVCYFLAWLVVSGALGELSSQI